MKREPTAADRIYEALRQRILTCEYGEDMAFNEVQLANEFGVSRTPVREALHRLEGKNFVSITKAGAQLLPMDILQLRDCYECKNVLFIGIAILACDRITDARCKQLREMVSVDLNGMDDHTFINWMDKVYRFIYSTTRNSMFEVVMDSSFDNLFRFISHCIVNDYCDRDKIGTTLISFAEAIIARNRKEAIVRAAKHIDESMHITPPSAVLDDGIDDLLSKIY
ncbi:MAG: GntR family transcriptional regulator [Clostridia bacterium]|nr:GntR family transcriptional regulator [Clostridia bacterium]